MKHFTIPITCSIFLLILSACNNETDTNQQFDISVEPSPSSPPQIQLPFTSPNEENGASLDQNQNKPIALDDFRNAIDSVVQDSIQEEVEKAVEEEMSKNTNNQK